MAAETMEFALTPQQAAALSALAPSGFSLQAIERKPRRPCPPKKAPVPIKQKTDASKTAVEKAWRSVRSHPAAQAFLLPLNGHSVEFPEKLPAGLKPGGLSEIEAKVRAGAYTKPAHLEPELTNIFKAGVRCFSPQHEMAGKAAQLLEVCTEVFARQPKPADLKNRQRLEQMRAAVAAAERAPTPDRELTLTEKLHLAELIHTRLKPEHMWDLWKIVAPERESEDEVEFDLEELPTGVLRRVQAYVNEKVRPRRSSPTCGRNGAARTEKTSSRIGSDSTDSSVWESSSDSSH